MKRLLATFLLASSLGGCITQTTNVCKPEECCPPVSAPTPGTMEPGTLYVVPRFASEESFRTYLDWFHDEAKRPYLERLHLDLQRKIMDDIGPDFPRVNLPNMDDDVLSALSLTDVALDGVIYSAGDGHPFLSDPAIRSALQEIGLRVHQALNDRNPELWTVPDPYSRAEPPFVRRVSYVVEEGVTYCIYVTEVFQGVGPFEKPLPNVHNWSVCHYEGEEHVDLFLDAYVIIKQVY